MPDFKTWVPQPRIARKGPYTVEAAGYEKKEGETIPRRHPRCKDKLAVVPEEGVTTIFELNKRGAEKFGNSKCLAWRRLVKTHEEVKKVKKMVDGKEEMVDKKWTYSELSGYEYMTYNDFFEMCRQVGAGYKKLGLNAGDRVQLYAATSPHWFANAHGSATQSMPIVTAYDTLGEEGLKHSLAQTKAKAIFLDPALLPKIINPLKDSNVAVEHVVYDNLSEVKQADLDKLRSEHPRINVMSYDELLQLGKTNMVEPTPPTAEDLCCIMYTSGSTGTPKGVLITHRNVIGAVAGADVIVGDYLGPGDSLLAYLPLAHILEFVFENYVLFIGGNLGYGNPRTLSDQSVRNCKGDIREFKPTVMIGVPAVWESVKKGIMGKVGAGSFVVKNMFWGAMSAKQFLMANNLPGAGVLDAIVFAKIREATGGNLRITLSAGGPISPETDSFISMAITPMLGGYGLTETTAMGAIMDPMAWESDALGALPGSIEVKLVDFPDAGYLSTNKPPQGEIWIRGAPVTKGYLDLEEETKEAYTDDGWFKTGDIGEFDKLGYIKIIDRKKNLVKTLNGEYIALEKLESTYRSATVVANICVYADPNKTKPVAIVVPAEPALRKLAKENGIQGESVEELVHNQKLNGLVLKEMQGVGRKGGLSGIELIDGVVLADEEWTPQNNFLTAAQKLNRKLIVQRYQKEIDKAYGSS